LKEHSDTSLDSYETMVRIWFEEKHLNKIIELRGYDYDEIFDRFIKLREDTCQKYTDAFNKVVKVFSETLIPKIDLPKPK